MGLRAATTTDGERIRRFEPFPRWGYVLLAITLVVGVLSVWLGFHDRLAPDGTHCGAALFPTSGTGAACHEVVVDALPLAVWVGAAACVLTVASVATLSVRAWIKREPSTPD